MRNSLSNGSASKIESVYFIYRGRSAETSMQLLLNREPELDLESY